MWFRKKGSLIVEVSERDLTNAFAVPDTEAWWLAVHQTLNQAEREIWDGAKARTKDSNLCIAAVGAAEGIDLIRQKLIDKRAAALRTNQDAIHKGRNKPI